MCGIAGIFIKEPTLEGQIGELFSPMLSEMTERGPDSAGIAIYREPKKEFTYKYSIVDSSGRANWDSVMSKWSVTINQNSEWVQVGQYKLLQTQVEPEKVKVWLNENFKELNLMSSGEQLEIYKDVGSPKQVLETFDVKNMSGLCIMGHTRMATESKVDVEGCHPYTTGNDLCIVHNGSYANHNTIRRILKDHGYEFDSLNDTEVAAKYVQWKLEQGQELDEILSNMHDDFSGFYTLAIGFKNQFAIVRDAFACKPMVVAEHENYVACASEFRALAQLPNIEDAKIFEPVPEEIYLWKR